MAEGPQLRASAAGWARPSDLDYTEARGRLDGADPDRVSDRAISAATISAARSARATTSSKSRSSTTSSTRTAAGVMGLEKDMVCVMIHSRLARPGLPGLRRRPGDAPQGAGEVRHRPARPPARLRPGRQPGRPALHRRHACGGQLRLVQPPAAHAPGPRGLRRASSAARGRRCR